MSFTVSQNLFADDNSVVTVVECSDDALGMEHLQPLLDTAGGVLGVSATYGKQCRLSSIAFSTLSRALVLNIPASHVPRPKQQNKQRRVARTRSLIQDHLLLNHTFQKFAFSMDKVAVALYLDLSVRISDGVDMLSAKATDSRRSLQALMKVMGGEANLQKQNVQSLFFATSDSPAANATTKVALQAWAACRTAVIPSRFNSIKRINTKIFPKAHLVAIASIYRDAERLEMLKPAAVKNEVVTDRFRVKKGIMNLNSIRFSTRIRKSKNQVLQISVEDKGTTRQITGRARKVNGRSARIKISESVQGDKILSVTTVGKDDPTRAETNRKAIIMEMLQDKTKVLSSSFFLALWLPMERLVWSKSEKQNGTIPIKFSRELNVSQRAAVEKILSDKDEDRIVLIQGPPGTGKTTVIAASVKSYCHFKSDQCIWVIAQSNVAVKNIAEKFINEGFLEFRLLVSMDFHFDWHEHLYKELKLNVIRSDKLVKLSIVEASRLFLDSKVILCTISMLSNPAIDTIRLIVPVDMIIVDEASQIECGDYVSVLHQFRSTLSKLVFIGDDKQLPPYGQEDIPQLRSVFEFPHLRRSALFLNMQYRMPHVIGNFISRNVYGSKLLTRHPFTTSNTCLFVDVNKGREAKMGHSWINDKEARIVGKLARLYESQNMSFRIITPYDAQRSRIENLLKSERLTWQDKVFNVDSFQGNEDKHIIVSVVRSNKPGFLRNERRTNVMLTRCKESMVICSSRAFLSGEASETLVGKLAATLGEENWMSEEDVLNGRVSLQRLPRL